MGGNDYRAGLRQLSVLLSLAQWGQLNEIKRRTGEGTSDVIRRLVVEEAGRGGRSDRSDAGRAPDTDQRRPRTTEDGDGPDSAGISASPGSDKGLTPAQKLGQLVDDHFAAKANHRNGTKPINLVDESIGLDDPWVALEIPDSVDPFGDPVPAGRDSRGRLLSPINPDPDIFTP